MFPEYDKIKTNEHMPLKGLNKDDRRLSIDEIDRRIPKLLLQDARFSYREIARQTKLSTTTVIERLKKLRINGIITGYSVNLDSRKLGFGLTAIIELVGTKVKLLRAVTKMKQLPNVYAIYHTTGDVDVIVVAKFKTVDELQNFLGNLYRLMSIQRSETRIVLSTIKEDFRVIV
jgi:DNA-binding Lrp family transcriptional regulator